MQVIDMTDLSHTALIIVDSQQGALEGTFWGTARSNPSYESNIIKLLAAFRPLRGPKGPWIIHVYHDSINPASPLFHTSEGMAFHPSSLPEPHEPVFPKKTNSAFQSSDLGDFLKAKKIWKVYFAGLSVDLCLGSTIRHASDLDVGNHRDEEEKPVKGDLVLIEDATAAWAKNGGHFDAETVHRVHVESLKGEFARVVTTDEVLKEFGE
jgi:nicotinamidase-related amidase